MLHPDRTDLEDVKYDVKNRYFAQLTNPQGISGGPEKVFEGADAVFCYTKPGPDVAAKRMVAKMAKDAMLFARVICAGRYGRGRRRKQVRTVADEIGFSQPDK